MPARLQLEAVNFGFEVMKDEEGNLIGIALLLDDPSPTPPLGIQRIAVPFSADGWVNFKRAVAADGEVVPIELAKGLPHRMDIPKGI